MADIEGSAPNDMPRPDSLLRYVRRSDVVVPLDEWKARCALLATAQDRIFDMLLCDDGQAWKEARRYLGRTRPDLASRLYRAIPVKVIGSPRLEKTDPWITAVQGACLGAFGVGMFGLGIIAEILLQWLKP
jgi:hypothetical protein